MMMAAGQSRPAPAVAPTVAAASKAVRAGGRHGSRCGEAPAAERHGRPAGATTSSDSSACGSGGTPMPRTSAEVTTPAGSHRRASR